MNIIKLLRSNFESDVFIGCRLLIKKDISFLIDFFKEYGDRYGREGCFKFDINQLPVTFFDIGFAIKKENKFLAFYGRRIFLDTEKEHKRSVDEGFYTKTYNNEKDIEIDKWF